MARRRQVGLSLCMIVKDEEDNLPRALNSVRDLVDEMIIVDTGSSDSTPRIAQEMGAQVYTYQWDGDFSAPKNFALQKARGKWILFLDADEEFPQESREKIPPLLKKTKIEGYLFTILSYRGPSIGPNYDEVPFLRLFRNRPQYRYQRAVHEQLTGFPYNTPAMAERRDIKILHYGYLDQEIAKKQKGERNLRILQQDLTRRPPDPYDYYYLGLEYLRQGHYDQALTFFAKARENLDPQLGWAGSLIKDQVLCLIKKGDLEGALALVEQGLELYPDYTDLKFHQGILLGERGEYQAAAAVFEECLAMGPAPAAKYATDGGVGGFRAWFLLGQMQERLGQLQAAASSYEKAVEANPGFIQPLYRLAPLLLALKGVPEGRKELEAYFELTTPGHRLLLADIWSLAGQYAWVLEYTAPPYPQGPLGEQGAYLRGLAYLRLGQLEEALPFLQKVSAASPYYKEAGLGLAYIYWSKDQKENALEVLQAIGADENTYLTLAQMFFQEAVAIAREGAKRFPEAEQFHRILRLAGEE